MQLYYQGKLRVKLAMMLPQKSLLSVTSHGTLFEALSRHHLINISKQFHHSSDEDTRSSGWQVVELGLWAQTSLFFKSLQLPENVEAASIQKVLKPRGNAHSLPLPLFLHHPHLPTAYTNLIKFHLPSFQFLMFSSNTGGCFRSWNMATLPMNLPCPPIHP